MDKQNCTVSSKSNLFFLTVVGLKIKTNKQNIVQNKDLSPSWDSLLITKRFTHGIFLVMSFDIILQGKNMP